VGSAPFAGSRRRRELLAFLVEETLAGRTDTLKAYKIGRQVLDRPSGFDPQSDPIVRVEVGRLRSTLDAFYRSHPGQRLEIGVPKGGYVVEFTRRDRSDDGSPDSRRCVLHLMGLRAMSDRATEMAEAIREAVATTVTAASPDTFSLHLADTESDLTETDGSYGSGVGCRLAAKVWVVDQRIRVAVELSAPNQAAPVWTGSFDEELTNVHQFDVIDRIAERIAWLIVDDWGPFARAGLRLQGDDASPTISASQHRYYRALDVVQPDGLDLARASLTDATNEAPSDPRTLSALADTTVAAWLLGVEVEGDALAVAEEMAIRAIAADPRLPEAHLSMGYVHYANRRSEAMRIEFEHALELGPSAPNTLHCAAFLWAFDGEWERADRLTRRAVELNPDLPAYWHLVPCIAALHRGESERTYVESLQVGDSMSFLGPAFRLACGHELGIDGGEDAEQVASMMPAAYSVEEAIGRAVHDGAIAEILIGAVRASSAALPS
jgi:hypothetical protein